MFIIKTKNEPKIKATEPIAFEVNKNVANLQLKKKNGSTLIAKVDAEDLQRVLAAGDWFAEWHKDYNSYLVQHYIEGSNQKGKESLQAFLLGEGPKTPIRHLNGDTLDNRKTNLELYDRNTHNHYKELNSDTVAVILRDSKGVENGRAIVDKADLYRVMNNGFPWVLYKNDDKPHAVANTPKGRLYLDSFIMNSADNMNVHHINLNTLDNRKSNLETVKKSND